MWLAALGVLIKVLTYSLVLLTVIWCWFQWSNRDLLRTARKLPTVYPTLPLLGHTYLYWGLEGVTRILLDACQEAMAQGIKTGCIWIGPFPMVVVVGQDDMQKVLNSSSMSEKADEYKFFKPIVGDGLLTAPTATWKVTRRHINPLFHPQNLELLMPAFNSNSRELVTNMSELVGQAPVDVLHYTMDTALKTVCQMIFGINTEFQIQSKDFQDLKKLVEKVPELIMRRIIFLYLRVDVIFNYLCKKELQEQRTFWDQFTDAPLKMARVKHMELGKQNENHHGNLQLEPTNLVELYTAMQQSFPMFTDETLRKEIVTMYLTGTDTVSLHTASCLLLLAQYQDIQERLYQEIMSVVGTDDDVTMQDLHRMPYLDQVYKESLRWSTIVPFIARRTTEAITLSTCSIPAGYTVALCLYGLNMDPKTFTNPKQFNPERFSPKNTEGNEKNTFLPFSGGPRSCIGKRYSEMLMKVMTVHFLRRYKVKTKMDVHNLKMKLVGPLVSEEGYNISLENRI